MEIALIVILALSNVFFVTIHRQERRRLEILTTEDNCLDLGSKLDLPKERMDVWTACEVKRMQDIAAEKAEADNHAAHLLDEYR